MSRRAPIRRAANMQLPEERKRSWQAPMWAIGIALVGYPLLRDLTADSMQRYTYRNAQSCACAYSTAQCSFEGGEWVGPWFATRASDRKYDDPGQGKDCSTARSSSFHGGYASGGPQDEITANKGSQFGRRGGFGGSGRVRGAGG